MPEAQLVATAHDDAAVDFFFSQEPFSDPDSLGGTTSFELRVDPLCAPTAPDPAGAPAGAPAT